MYIFKIIARISCSL